MTSSLGQECLKNKGGPAVEKQSERVLEQRATVLRERCCYKCKQIGDLRKDCPLRGGSGSSEVVRPGSGWGHFKWWVWLGVALTS